jgi:hypothetical protein
MDEKQLWRGLLDSSFEQRVTPTVVGTIYRYVRAFVAVALCVVESAVVFWLLAGRGLVVGLLIGVSAPIIAFIVVLWVRMRLETTIAFSSMRASFSKLEETESSAVSPKVVQRESLN